MSQKVSRRGVLKGMGAAGAAAGLGLWPDLARAEVARRPKPFRVAHLTDMHIFANRPISDRGVAFTLEHLMNLPTKPDLVITGGDNMTGTMGAKEETARDMRRRWEAAFRDKCDIPMLHCTGNHDIWGWNKSSSGATGNEPLYGKAWARDMFQVERLYSSHELGGWKIILLDSVHEDGDRYMGKVDDEQFEWLKGELQGNTKPVLVVSHIPVTGISPMILDASPIEGGHRVPNGSVCRNQYALVKLFADHPQVKLVLAGHTHFYETLSFGACTYLNSGAVSGAWWRDPMADNERRSTSETPRLPRAYPGYVVIELGADGSTSLQGVRTNFEFDEEG